MTLLRLSIAATLIAAGAVTLQAQEARRGGSSRYREAVKKFDKNENGKLDGEEREAFKNAYQERSAARRKESDKDKESEKGKPATSRRPTWGGPQRGPGGSTRGDWEAHRKEAMKKYDSDQDGRLSETERREMFAAMRKRFEEMRQQSKKPAEGGRKAAPWERRRMQAESKAGESKKHDHAKHDHAKTDHGKKEHGKRDRAGHHRHGSHRHGSHRHGSHRHHKGHSRQHEGAKQKEGQSRGKGQSTRGEDKSGPDRSNARSREERVKAMVGAALHRAMSGDKNDDGKLNADEFPSRTAKPFGFYDTNQDGYVTRTELLTGMKKNMATSRSKQQ